MIRAAGKAVTTKSPFAIHRVYEPSSNVIALPSIVLLGCDADVEARCRSITSRARVLLRAIPIPFLRSTIIAIHPLVLVLPAKVHELAPAGFDMLAEEAGASLLKLERDPIAPIVLEYRIMESLIFAVRLRSRLDDQALSRPAS